MKDLKPSTIKLEEDLILETVTTLDMTLEEIDAVIIKLSE